MNETKHTPTPWFVSQYLDDGRWGIVKGDGEIVIGLAERLTEANARFIVTAVNAHDDLVAAVKAMEEHLSALCVMARDNTLYKWNSAGTVKTIHEARELLKKAEVA